VGFIEVGQLVGSWGWEGRDIGDFGQRGEDGVVELLG
jgi:hypothetical protein